MKVTIIMPAYNSEKYIRKAIKSCLNQTYSDIEVLIVNDGSSDGTSLIINEFERTDKRIRHVFQKNQGLVRARKTGVQNTITDYFIFLDSDDALEPYAVEELVNMVNMDPTIDIIFSNFYTEYENGVLLHKSRNDYYNINGYKDYAERILSKRIAPTIWGKLIRTDLFLKIETPDEITIGEDAVAILQLLALKPKVGYVDSYIYNYIQHSNSMVNVVDEKKNKQRILLISTLVHIIPSLYDKKMINSLKLFIYGEIFTFLRDGGSFGDIRKYYDFCKKGTSKQVIPQVIGYERFYMIKLFNFNNGLGVIYRFIYNFSRNMRNIFKSRKLL